MTEGIAVTVERNTVNYDFNPGDPANFDLSRLIRDAIVFAQTNQVLGLTVTVSSNGVPLQVIVAFCSALIARNPEILSLDGIIIDATDENLIGQVLTADASPAITTTTIGLPPAP